MWKTTSAWTSGELCRREQVGRPFPITKRPFGCHYYRYYFWPLVLPKPLIDRNEMQLLAKVLLCCRTVTVLQLVVEVRQHLVTFGTQMSLVQIQSPRLLCSNDLRRLQNDRSTRNTHHTTHYSGCGPTESDLTTTSIACSWEGPSTWQKKLRTNLGSTKHPATGAPRFRKNASTLG